MTKPEKQAYFNHNARYCLAIGAITWATLSRQYELGVMVLAMVCVLSVQRAVELMEIRHWKSAAVRSPESQQADREGARGGK